MPPLKPFAKLLDTIDKATNESPVACVRVRTPQATCLGGVKPASTCLTSCSMPPYRSRGTMKWSAVNSGTFAQ